MTSRGSGKSASVSASRSHSARSCRRSRGRPLTPRPRPRSTAHSPISPTCEASSLPRRLSDASGPRQKQRVSNSAGARGSCARRRCEAPGPAGGLQRWLPNPRKCQARCRRTGELRGWGAPLKEGLWVSERFLQVRLQRLIIIQEARGRRVSAHSPSPKARQPSGQDPHSLIPSGWLLYRAPEEEAPRRPFPARPSALPYHLGPPGSTSTF